MPFETTDLINVRRNVERKESKLFPSILSLATAKVLPSAKMKMVGRASLVSEICFRSHLQSSLTLLELRREA